MKTLLALGAILMLAVPVWAEEDILAACQRAFTSEDYQIRCIENLSRRYAVQEQGRVQMEMARQQALGMAAFGSGNALINGMNQGFQMMQVKPYMLPPAQNYLTR